MNRADYKGPTIEAPTELPPPPPSNPFGKLVREEISGDFVHRSYELSDEWRDAMQNASKHGAETKRQEDKDEFAGFLIIGGYTLFLVLLVFFCGFMAGMASQQ